MKIKEDEAIADKNKKIAFQEKMKLEAFINDDLFSGDFKKRKELAISKESSLPEFESKSLEGG